MEGIEKNRTYKCPNCGADLRFDAAAGRVVCDYCDSVFDPQDYDPETGKWDGKTGQAETGGFWQNPAEDDPDTETMNEFICTQCGARLYSTDLTLATFCSYCGSSTLLEHRIVHGKKPDCVIPYRISREEAAAAYQRKVKTALFAPNYYREGGTVEKFRGIYMPYWVYTLRGRRSFRVRGERKYRRGDYIYTTKYEVTTKPDIIYDGLCYDAASAFSDNLSQAIAPFDIHEAKAYNPAYLSGFYADAGDVEAGTYQQEAKEVVKADISQQLYRQSREYARCRVAQSSIGSACPVETSSEKGLFPVWFLSVRSRDKQKGERISYAVVNGQTGKVAADIPISFPKYLLGSLLLSIPIFLWLCLAASFTPKVLLNLAMVLSAVAFLIANHERNRVYTRENGYDDAGHMSVKKLSRKQEEELRQARKKKTKKAAQAKKKATAGSVLLGVLVPVALSFVFIFFLGAMMSAFQGDYVIYLFFIWIWLMIRLANKIIAREPLSLFNGDRSALENSPLKDKMSYLLKTGGAFAAALIMRLLDPVSDAWYYGTAIVSMALIAWSFYDIIKAHNELTRRQLPQFEARGGDAHVNV